MMTATSTTLIKNKSSYTNIWKTVLLFNVLFLFKPTTAIRLSQRMPSDSKSDTLSLFSFDEKSCTPNHFGWETGLTPSTVDNRVTTAYVHGDLVACWDTNFRTSIQSNIFCSILDIHGKTLAPPFLVSEETQFSNVEPVILEATSDRFWVAYYRNMDTEDGAIELALDFDSYTRVYDNLGTPRTDSFRVNSALFERQYQIELIQLNNQNILASYSSENLDHSFHIRGTIYTPTSSVSKPEFTINLSQGSMGEHESTLLANGNVVVSWNKLVSTGDRRCYFIIINEEGEPVTSEVRITTSTSGEHINRDILAFDNKTKFMTIWMHQNNHYFQIYSQDGTRIVSTVQINDNNSLIRGSVFAQEVDGKIITLWYESKEDSSTHYMRCKLYDYSGTPASPTYTLQEGTFLSTGVTYHPLTIIKNTPNIAIIFVEDGTIKMRLISTTLNFGVIYPAASYVEDTPVSLPGTYLIKTLYDPGTITITAMLSDSMLGVLSSTYVLTPPATDNWNALTGTLTFTSATLDEINCYLDNLIFTPTGESSVSGTITFIANDGVNTTQTTIQLTGQPVNDPPVVSTNYFPIEQNGQLILSLANLDATDKDNPPLSTLTARISNDYYCQFTDKNGMVILGTDGEDIEFTLQQVDDAEITLEHTPGSTDNPPEFQITFWDGQAESSRVGAVVIYGGNAIPSFTKNWMEIGERSNTTLTPAYLGIRDDDDDPETVTVDIHDPRNGYFAYKSNPTLAVNTFLYRASVRENLRFFSTNDQEPSYSVSLTDDTVTTSPLPAVVTFYRLPTLTTTPLTITEPVEEIRITPDNVQVTNRDTSGNDGDILMEPTITGAHLEATDQRGIAITTPFPYAKMQQEKIVLIRNLGEPFSLTWTASNAGFATTQDISMSITLAFDHQPRVVNSEIPFSPSNSTIFLSPEHVTLAYDFLSPLDIRIGFDIGGWELWRLNQGTWLPTTHVTQWEINQGYAKLNATDASNVPHGNLTAWTDDPSQPWLTQSLHFLRLTTPQTHAPSTEAPSQPSSATNSPLSTNSLLPSSTHLNRITQQGTPIPRDTNQALNYGLVFGLLAAGFSILAASTTIAYRYWQYRTEKKRQHAETTPKLNGMFDNGLGISRETSQFNRLSSHSPSVQGPAVSEHIIPVSQPSLEAGQQTEMAQTRHLGMSSPGAQPTSAMWSAAQTATSPPSTATMPLSNGAS